MVRDIEALNYSSADISFNILATVPGPQNVSIAFLNGDATTQTTQWQGRAVLNSGEELQAIVSSADNNLFISGYLLSAP